MTFLCIWPYRVDLGYFCIKINELCLIAGPKAISCYCFSDDSAARGCAEGVKSNNYLGEQPKIVSAVWPEFATWIEHCCGSGVSPHSRMGSILFQIIAFILFYFLFFINKTSGSSSSNCFTVHTLPHSPFNSYNSNKGDYTIHLLCLHSLLNIFVLVSFVWCIKAKVNKVYMRMVWWTFCEPIFVFSTLEHSVLIMEIVDRHISITPIGW